MPVPSKSPHLCNSLKEGQAEPLEEGKGPDAACHLHGRHGGHLGVQVSGNLLEDLGLVEIQLSLKEEREKGQPLTRSWYRSHAWVVAVAPKEKRRLQGGFACLQVGLTSSLLVRPSLCCTHQLPVLLPDRGSDLLSVLVAELNPSVSGSADPGKARRVLN